MSKEEKLQRLLEMQEHPERYTDEEIRQLMADEECRQLYEQMVRAADAYFSEKSFAEENVEAETEEGRGEVLDSEESTFEEEKPKYTTLPQRRWLRMAASFVGILMLCGIAYATYRIVVGGNTDTMAQQSQASNSSQQIADGGSQEPQVLGSDTLRIFENAELSAMLSEMAAYYHYEVTYQNDSTKHIRLYFTWDKTSKIEDVVAMFNKFDRIHIKCEEQKLIVE